MNLFSFNFPSHEYIFLYFAPPPPHKFKAIEIVGINRVSVLSGSCYLSQKGTFYLNKTPKNFNIQGNSVVKFNISSLHRAVILWTHVHGNTQKLPIYRLLNQKPFLA